MLLSNIKAIVKGGTAKTTEKSGQCLKAEPRNPHEQVSNIMADEMTERVRRTCFYLNAKSTGTTTRMKDLGVKSGMYPIYVRDRPSFVKETESTAKWLFKQMLSILLDGRHY